MRFLSPPVRMHPGLTCIVYCLYVCNLTKIQTIIVKKSLDKKSFVAMSVCTWTKNPNNYSYCLFIFPVVYSLKKRSHIFYIGPLQRQVGSLQRQVAFLKIQPCPIISSYLVLAYEGYSHGVS